MSQPILTRLLRGHHRPPLTSLLLLTTPSPTKTNTKLILQASFSSSTSRLTFDPDSYLAQARQTFAARQPTHIIPDTLSPTNSYLLTLSLADQIPSLFPWYHHHHQPSSSPIHYPGTTTTQQKEARHPPDYTHRLLPTATLLFHFSALTYNAHQIHLNPLYAQKCEGYKDLLVHGPLTLVLMISALRAALAGARLAAGPGGKKGTPYVVSLTYRNLAPLYVDEPLTVCLRRRRGVASSSGTAGDETEGLVVWDVWIEGPLGGMAVKGEAVTTG